MKSIAFIDTEVEPRSGKVLDLGSVKDDGSYVHTPSVAALIRFLHGTQFIGGHNIINHDIRYIGHALHHAGIMFLLRNTPCLSGCVYCNNTLDIHKGLKRLFGFDSFKTFGGEALQEKAVEAAVHNKSLLAIFPTGGGKSITFQVPAT